MVNSQCFEEPSKYIYFVNNASSLQLGMNLFLKALMIMEESPLISKFSISGLEQSHKPSYRDLNSTSLLEARPMG